MRIGIDLGGTKIEGILLDQAGCELARKRVPTPQEDYEGTVAAVIGVARELEGKAGREATLGVGMPGAISPVTGRVKNANSTWLNGRTFHIDLEKAWGRPLRTANDANCLAVSEAVDGAGEGAHTVFAVIIGTGCGGGIAVDRNPLVGPNAAAGEFGHIQLPWMDESELPGPACYCGKHGCLETWISGTGFRKDFERVSGRRMTSPDIVAAARGGDALAKANLARYVDRLARGLGAVVTMIDPDVIVLGGGMSNVDLLYEEVPALLPRYTFGGECVTPVRKAVHGDSSGVRGAAWLW